ncbi:MULTISPECIES: DUF2318 domain-containing protein [Actinomyces]|uniref:DUF2318 domain-containing protein n=1 Tax=Actinomyces respiraculi TaxID=2744574 RepID=A0A7T0LJ60_9ACTO|nr:MULTISPECIES: DUF2318 domain-containing protein [Actinomyces]QPL04744.1 DUF2318 domain-containing protein [Actinomyces respiraculi]
MLERFVSVVGGATLPFLLYAAAAVILAPALIEGWPRSSRWRLAGALVGTAGGIIFAALRALAIIHDRTGVTVPTLIVCVLADAALLTSVLLLARRPRWGAEGRLGAVAQVAACTALAAAFFRAVPEVVLQLAAFIEPGEEVVSSTMLLRVLGFVGAWACVAILSFLYYRAARRAPVVLTRASLAVFLTVVTAVHLLQLLRVLNGTQRIRITGTGFRLLSWAANNFEGAILLTAAAIWLVPLAVELARALGRAPAQANPARLRAVRAERRRSRRWVLASAGAFTLLVLTRTVAVAKLNEVPTLSEPEPYELAASGALIPTSLLADGHLHRFSYEATNGTQVRWIALLKNGGAYGVGLDACESCGPSGYYESDGKVICKRCDVAINPATVGFKGGCNPIPIEYTVEDGTMLIPTEVLEASAEVFA